MSEAEKTSKPGFFKNLKSEFKKCTWPKKEDLVKQSALVIVVSVLLGVLIAGNSIVEGFAFNVILR